MTISWRRSALMVVALGGVSLAGCSRSEPEPPPEMNMTVHELEPTPEPSPTEIAPPIVEPTPEPMNDTAPLPPPEEAAPDEQMLDDASATGMTARSERDAGDAREAPAERERRD